jgi:hypothetical protein
MRKWNAILSISIVAVLLIPIMMAGSIASACCGVGAINLKADDSPDPLCIPGKVAISGSYDVIALWPNWKDYNPYQTGVVLKVYKPDGSLQLDRDITVATGQTELGSFTFKETVEPINMVGTYKYTVQAWTLNKFDGRMWSDTIGGTIVAQKCMVPIDIKPTSCPNPLNLGSKGVLPVAILGTPKFDVNTVIPEKVILVLPNGPVTAERYAYEDVAKPQPPPITDCDTCNTAGPDGFMDLTLKFDVEEVVAKLGDVKDGDCVKIELLAPTTQGPRWGVDFVVIIAK